MSAPPFIALTSYHYAKVMRWLCSQMALLKGAAVKILWEIADRTFGFRKWEDRIAISQFELACGLSRDTVIATIEDLLSLCLIRRARSGNSYRYALQLPAQLFVEKPATLVDNHVDNVPHLIHTDEETISFFTQNQEGSPQNDEQMVGFFDPQIKDVTQNGTTGNQWSELLSTLTDINATLPHSAYVLRNLPRWVKRAMTLGMTWGDLWTLWRACVRVGRNPLALFLSRLLGDGTPPTGKMPKPPSRAQQQTLDTHRRWRAMQS